MAEDDVSSYTATQDAGLFLHDRPQYPEDPRPPGLGTLTALFGDGTTQRLATRVVGVPLADPAGHVAAWTVRVDPRTALVTAFDTAELVELGSHRIELTDDDLNVVTAVVGDTVYLTTEGRPLAWQARDPGSSPAVVDGVGRGTTAVVGANDDGVLVVGPELAVSWLGQDGTQHAVGALGTLSPHGPFLIAGTDNEDNYDRIVVSVPSGDRVDLDLAADAQIYQARWTADGTLVVATVSSAELEGGWDDALEVTSFACDLADGGCRALDGGPRFVAMLALYEDSFLGQFLVAYGGELG